jgi:hypothetical protein
VAFQISPEHVIDQARSGSSTGDERCGNLRSGIADPNACQGAGQGTLTRYAEEVMAARGHWSDLSERDRRLLTIAAVAEGILKLVALIDIKRRPASQIRGPKWLWATAVTVVSSAGVVPISYFLFGRRQPRS